MAVKAKASITLVRVDDGNSVAEITNFYMASPKSTGVAAPQSSGGRNYVENGDFSRTIKMNVVAKNPDNYPRSWSSYNSGITNAEKVYHAYVDKDTFGYNVCVFNESDGSKHWKAISYYNPKKKFSLNNDYRISVDIYQTGKGCRIWGGFHCFLKGGTNQGFHGGMYDIRTANVGKWERLSANVPMHKDTDFEKPVTFFIYGYNFDTSSILYIKDVSLSISKSTATYTPAPEDLGWSTIVPALTPTNKYLWNYEMITGSDGMVISYTSPRIIGVYGDKGQTGATGATGNGIKSITEYYQVSTSNSEAPTSWVTTVPTLTATNKYLWNYEKVIYTNGSSADTAKRVIGVYGDKGQTGPQGPQGSQGPAGPPGKGIKSTTITYQAGTSGTLKPSGNWIPTIPTVTSGQYLWSKTLITYTDSTTSETYSVSYIPKNGDVGPAGQNGAAGTGVASIVQQYYLSTSKYAQTGGSWINYMPTWSNGNYLWTRYQITYKDPTSTAYTTPICDSSWEAVNDIKVGGKNLLLKSGIPSTNNSYPVQTYTMTEKMVADQIYTCTLWGSLGAGKKYYALYLDGGSIHLASMTDNKDGTFSAVFKGKAGTADVSKIYVYPFDSTTVVDCTISRIKLEKGNKATDWTPAPEDVQDEIDNNANDIYNEINKQKADLLVQMDSITASVDQAYVKQSEFGDYKVEVDSLVQQTATDLTMNFSGQITELGDSTNAQLEQFTKFIKFDGENGITIGSGDNSISLTIDNTKGIIFSKNGVPFGTWDGNDFHTGNIVVDVNERAQFGNFAFIPRDDGSLSFLKVK